MRVDILDYDDTARMADRLRGQYRLIWLIGVSTGLRISDILQLKARQCCAAKAYIQERKTGKNRAVYMRKNIRAECGAYAKEHGISANGKMFTVSRVSVWKAFKRAARKEKICRNVGTHTMRKSYSVAYMAKGHNIQDLQKRLNHSHLGDTLGYITTNEQLGLDEQGKKKARRKNKK